MKAKYALITVGIGLCIYIAMIMPKAHYSEEQAKTARRIVTSGLLESRHSSVSNAPPGTRTTNLNFRTEHKDYYLTLVHTNGIKHYEILLNDQLLCTESYEQPKQATIVLEALKFSPVKGTLTAIVQGAGEQKSDTTNFPLPYHNQGKEF